MTQRRALQTRILKMENYENAGFSPLYMQIGESCESSRIPIAQEKPAALLQERGASAKRTQADFRKRLDVNFVSTEPSAPGKPAALFSFGSESSAFKNADPSNLERSVLEGN